MNPQSTIHNPQSRWLLLGLMLLSSFILRPSSFAAESPLVIPFQGQVTNQQGQLVASGQYSIIFNLYDQAVGGQPLWTERHSKVGVVSGMVNVFLGSIPTNSLVGVDFGQTRYLGITVDVDDKPTTADPEMVPRHQIIPAFHTKQSERTRKMDVLDGNGLPVAGKSFGWSSIINNGDPDPAGAGRIPGAKLADASVTVEKVEPSLATAFVPPGSVMAFAGTVEPPGWKFCNGASVERTDPMYTRLFSVIGTTYGAVDGSHFNLPDMRGRVPAGKDDMGGAAANRLTGAGGIAGATLGAVGGAETRTLTAAQSGLAAHSHTAPDHDHGTGTGGGFVNNSGGGYYQPGSVGHPQLTVAVRTAPASVTIQPNAAQDASAAHSVTQPTIVLNYIIKY